MSSTSRQNSLLVAQDWKKVYQTFREADFQSYDFETLRKSMIDYLRLYYPEDFNDFIESSEYIALIDLIAFLGQSLAFRTDLNARENFLDTAERRDSILKLARLISYSPKRAVSASGLLKINSVTTTETVVDSNGIDLANIVVTWNDTANSNWSEQFSLIFNASLLNSQLIGNPGNSQVINGIRTDEYTINITSGTVPAFPFSATVNGGNLDFEAVSATSSNQSYIYETDPRPSGKFNFLYRNDNRGNASLNTGYFLYFKQGKLQSVDFTLGEAVPNRVLNVGYNSINNSDVWLYALNSSKFERALWTAVPAIAGVNVIYNKSSERDLYQINTREGDQIDLVFGDGSFANVPQGDFRTYFRTNAGQTYKITPDELQNVTIAIPYVSRAGVVETLTVRAALNYTVTNATANESIDDIRQKAPQQYYTQGRMITGEDYNIIPYTAFSNVLKVKAVNRTSSGISRFLDVQDTSGKYSSTNIFAQDGYLYKEDVLPSTNFSIQSSTSARRSVIENLMSILDSKEMTHFYYDHFTRHNPTDYTWHLSSLTTNGSTGYFNTVVVVDNLDVEQILQIGSVSSEVARFIAPGAIIKFSAGPGKYFNAQNQIKTGEPQYAGDQLYVYSSVKQVIGDGTNGGQGSFANGTGPVTVTQKVPNGAIVEQIIPVFKNSLPEELIQDIAARVAAFNNFALRYDVDDETWKIVEEANIYDANNVEDPLFSLTSPVPGVGPDASWLIRFEYNTTVGYLIYWRGTDYTFESKVETKFYFDDKVRVYDGRSVIQDQIKILKVNTESDSSDPLGVDYTWHIHKNIVDIDGYENQNKVLLTFSDNNNDGVPDNPDLFTTVVNPTVNPVRKLVFFKKEVGYDSFETFLPISSTLIVLDYLTLAEIQPNITLYYNGQVFYTMTDDKFYVLEILNGVYSLYETTDYKKYQGRENLYFQYRHNSPGYRRIDPSPNNIIDLFLLTNSYSTDYQRWINDSTNTLVEPVPPTTEQLKLEYSELENYKAISDTIIFNSAKFKPLFGNKSDPTLQAIFKVVKNVNLNISDNDIKSSVTGAVNAYFATENWDFGETFYFSELSAYLHSTLSPNVSSVIVVPKDPTALFGSLYQINAETNEILISSATVDNVEIISAVTASAINANFAGVNSVLTVGTI